MLFIDSMFLGLEAIFGELVTLASVHGDRQLELKGILKVILRSGLLEVCSKRKKCLLYKRWTLTEVESDDFQEQNETRPTSILGV